MSRIADGLQRAREQNASCQEERFESDWPMPPTITEVQVPWTLDESPIKSPVQRQTSSAPVRVESSAAPSVGQGVTHTGAVPGPPLPRPAAVPERAPQRPTANAPQRLNAPTTQGTEPEAGVAALVRSIFFVENRAVHRVLFTSVDDPQRSHAIAVRVAEAVAREVRGSICLADLDSRSPELHRFFQLEGLVGFSDAVLNPAEFSTCTYRVASPPNLWVLPAGTRTDEIAKAPEKKEVKRRIADLLRTFEYVVASTSPLALCGDAAALGSLFDGVVLVVDGGTTKAEAVRRADRQLRDARAPLLGIVIERT